MENTIRDLQSMRLSSTHIVPESWYIIAQGKLELKLYQFFPKTSNDQENVLDVVWTEPNISQSFVSQSGQYICIQRNGCNHLEVINIDDRVVLKKIEYPPDSGPKAVEFSPLDTHIMILTGWTPENTKNLNVYKLNDASTTPVLSIEYQKLHTIKRLPIWTNNEKYCILRTEGDINIYKNNKFDSKAPVKKLTITIPNGDNINPLPSSAAISLSPINRKGECHIGVFIPHQGKNNQGILRIYNIENLEVCN
ncbi:Translation initiation factor 2A [Babesia duncani]|uniref:Translation initiation factor 2A n=1 Tax=Babesia duncani TaxID=323732 RepID=A0AAD9PJ19_9APIC|nr:Translation initiation factor 2A [Babesia duncani]